MASSASAKPIVVPLPGRRAPARVGALLLHGLGGNPAELHPLALQMKSLGYQVHTPVIEGLAGGTDPDASLSWREWLEQAETQFDQLARSCDTVHVCGFCGGALLGLLLSARNRETAGDLVVVSPTFTGDGWAVPRSLQLFKLVTQRWFARYFTFHDRAPYGLKDERIRMVVRRMLEREFGPRMNEISGVKMLEFNRLARVASRELGDVTRKTLIVHAREDDISSLRNAERIARYVRGTTELTIVPDSYHEVLLDRNREVALAAIARFLVEEPVRVRRADAQAV